MDNCLLYDWITFSSPCLCLSECIKWLGLPSNLDWEKQLGSRLRYRYRDFFHGISIHYTPEDDDKKLNPGVCVEMSGSGCRAFETYTNSDIGALIERIKAYGYHVSRLDIAYDDFSGVIDLETMANQARNFWFTSRLQRCAILSESKISETEIAGLTVGHGSKSSRIYIRCYDKRYERSAIDELEHWVRFEIQLRDENAMGFINFSAPLGAKFSGVISNYLNYREQGIDENKRRWKLSPWWVSFLGDCEKISISSKKTEDYNRDRFNAYIWSLRNVIKTAILLEGPSKFLADMIAGSEALPARYDQLIRECGVHDLNEIRRFMEFYEKEIANHD